MAVYDKNGKVIKSAVNYGWEVDSADVPKALDMWVEYVGEDNALEDIARAMDDDTLIENVEWIAQQWGIGEEVEEERSAWDKYEKAKELMGVHELFTNLTQAAGYDELAEDLAYIFRMNDFRQWDDMEVYSSRKPIKSSKEEKVNPNDPHMKFKTLDPENKMDLREDIEDELEALLKKLHVKFDLETWNETVDYILSFFEEDNFYNPKNAKQAVHEWYLDTKDEFPDMFDSKKTKIASSAYREFIRNKMSIKSTHNLIKSSVEEEDPVEVLLKDAAQQLGATYKEGWWGKGIQEGDGRWNGGKWAVAVKKDYHSNLPSIYFISGPRVTPMNATVEKSERFPKDVVNWIRGKINDSNASRDSFEDNVRQLEHFQNNLINYVDVVNEYNKEVEIGLDTEDDYEARTVAEEIAQQTGFENYEIYNFYELSGDDYRDLDKDVRDKKVILFYLG